MDAITRINAVVFYKTGTLTTGSFRLTSIQATDIPEDELLSLVASVEKKSTHPVAQAIVHYASGRGVKPAIVTSLNELAGYGLEAEVEHHQVLVGNIRLLTDRQIAVPEELADCVATVVVCAVDGKYAGQLLLSDTLKEDAVDAIKKLKALKIDNIQMLSGINKRLLISLQRNWELTKPTVTYCRKIRPFIWNNSILFRVCLSHLSEMV